MPTRRKQKLADFFLLLLFPIIPSYKLRQQYRFDWLNCPSDSIELCSVRCLVEFVFLKEIKKSYGALFREDLCKEFSNRRMNGALSIKMKICVFGRNAQASGSYSCLPLRASDIVRGPAELHSSQRCNCCSDLPFVKYSGPFILRQIPNSLKFHLFLPPS